MRSFALLALAPLPIFAQAEKPVEIDTRYGIPGNARLFPQTNPKQAIESAIKAVEASRYDYLIAHILDAKYADGKIAERAKQLEAGADADLRAKRDAQKNDATIKKQDQLPDDPTAFAAAVKAEATARGFRQFLRDVQDKMTEDPTLLKDLKRFVREGTVAVDGAIGAVTLNDLKDRKVYVTQSTGRWFVENRQAEEK
jgi:hypothetical protein